MIEKFVVFIVARWYNEDANRNEYLEALKEYREEKGIDKLVTLFEKEQQFYLEKSKYFMWDRNEEVCYLYNFLLFVRPSR